MADELQQTLNRTSEKARIILERYAIMKTRLAELKAKAGELEQVLEKTRAENQRLKSQVEFLKMAAVVAPDRADIELIRAILSGLVREIDRCIVDLND